MQKVLFGVAAIVIGADAMAARPKVGKGTASKTSTNPLFGKAVAASTEKVEFSAAIPFLPRAPKLDGSMLGDIGFDPLGLSNLWDLNFLRAAELKHGRVGMLAATGFLVQEGYRLPGPASNPELFALAKTPLEALSSAPPLGLAQIVGICFLIELATSGSLLNTEAVFEEDGSDASTDNVPEPGNLGWDPLALSPRGQVNADYAIAELKHGRLAMLGAAGMLAGSLVSGKSIAEQTYNWLGLPFAA